MTRRCRTPHCPGPMKSRAKQAKYCSRNCGQAHFAAMKAGRTHRLEAPDVARLQRLGDGRYRVWLEGVPDALFVEAGSDMHARTRARMRHSRRTG